MILFCIIDFFNSATVLINDIKEAFDDEVIDVEFKHCRHVLGVKKCQYIKETCFTVVKNTILQHCEWRRRGVATQ